jgi:hypothetical protein
MLHESSERDGLASGSESDPYFHYPKLFLDISSTSPPDTPSLDNTFRSLLSLPILARDCGTIDTTLLSLSDVFL